MTRSFRRGTDAAPADVDRNGIVTVIRSDRLETRETGSMKPSPL
jgi:hypothetical protein